MIGWIREYFDQVKIRYPDEVDYQRARALSGMFFGIAVLTILAVAGLYAKKPSLEFNQSGDAVLTGIIVLMGVGLSLLQIKRGHLAPARIIFVGLIYLVSLVSMLTVPLLANSTPFMMLTLVAAGTLLGTRGIVSSNLIIMATFGYGLFSQGGFTESIETQSIQNEVLNTTIIFISAVAGVNLILWLFSVWNTHALTRSKRTTRQLRAIARITQSTSEYLELDELLPNIVEVIREQLEIYHAQVFLVDDQQKNAVLVASTGQAGKQLLARGHSLPVGSLSVIGQVALHNQVVYATDTSQDAVHKRNEFLPDTRSELALPLRDGETVSGALDVQSTQSDAFSPEDIEILQIMADQLSVTIRNILFFERTQANTEENRRLYLETRANLQDIERLNRQLTGTSWEDFFHSAQSEFAVKVEGGRLQRTAEWTPGLTQAVREQQAIVSAEGAGNTIAVPVAVRGNVIGAIEIELPAGTRQDEALDMAQAVSERLALSIDNSRLFEEAQTLAQQEQFINVVGGRLQTAGAVDEMLNIVLAELAQALGADGASVRLRAIAPAENGQEG